MHADIAVQLRNGKIDRLNLQLGFLYFGIERVYLCLERLMLVLCGIEQLLLCGYLALKRIELILQFLLAVRYGRRHALREHERWRNNARARDDKKEKPTHRPVMVPRLKRRFVMRLALPASLP